MASLTRIMSGILRFVNHSISYSRGGTGLEIIIARLTNCLQSLPTCRYNNLIQFSPPFLVRATNLHTGCAYANIFLRSVYVPYGNTSGWHFKKIYALCRIIKCGTNLLTFEMC